VEEREVFLWFVVSWPLMELATSGLNGKRRTHMSLGAGIQKMFDVISGAFWWHTVDPVVYQFSELSH